MLSKNQKGFEGSIKSVQPTAAAPVSWTGMGDLIATVAFWSQFPAAVAEF